MILSDKSIARMIESGQLEVEPDIDVAQLQPASLDVRLGDELYDPAIDRTIEADDGRVTLRPGVQYIGHTVDNISLPNSVAAMLTGRSTVGRRGIIIHKTAGWIDPGFEGQLTLELFNFSNEDQMFKVGDRVGQLVFFKLDAESQGYDGQYQGQTGPTEDGSV